MANEKNAQPKVRVRFKAYDHVILDKDVQMVVDAVRKNGNKMVGPVPLPTERQVYTILRAVHKYKDSREQFEIRTHKRVLDIIGFDKKLIDSLKNIAIDPGVQITFNIIATNEGIKKRKGGNK